MSTWLDHWDRRYTDRVRLLVEILPVLASEPGFALKGGTAINLFEHDLFWGWDSDNKDDQRDFGGRGKGQDGNR